MHGHEAELLSTTFLMLSTIGCGHVLKLVKPLHYVGYILACCDFYHGVDFVQYFASVFALSCCAIKNPSGGRMTCSDEAAHTRMNQTLNH